mgnify:CR=1 FL=1
MSAEGLDKADLDWSQALEVHVVEADVEDCNGLKHSSVYVSTILY